MSENSPPTRKRRQSAGSLLEETRSEIHKKATTRRPPKVSEDKPKREAPMRKHKAPAVSGPSILLVDANNLAARCFHAHKELSTRDGRNTAVAYGVSTVLENFISDRRIKKVIFCFDAGTPEKRKEWCPRYKMSRKEKKANDPKAQEEYEDMRHQIDQLPELLKYLGVESIKVPGYEADDLLAYYSHVVYKDEPTTVFSGDKDMKQLAGFHKTKVHLPSPRGDFKVFTEPVKHALLTRAMEGDSSDDIAGVKGIGPAGAALLLEGVPDEATPEEFYEIVSDKYYGGEITNKYKNNAKKLIDKKKDFLDSHKTMDLSQFLKEIEETDKAVLTPEEYNPEKALEYMFDYEFSTIANAWRRYIKSFEKMRALGEKA